LPAYKTYPFHVANYAALVVALGPPPGCVCGPRKAAALGCKLQPALTKRLTSLTLCIAVNAAWAQVATAALQATYDANVGPGGFAAPCPPTPLPLTIGPPYLIAAFPRRGVNDWHQWNPEINNSRVLISVLQSIHVALAVGISRTLFGLTLGMECR
jgi:hypothetical protein